MQLNIYILRMISLSITVACLAGSVRAASPKRTRSDKDITQIGRRNITPGFEFYSLDEERKHCEVLDENLARLTKLVGAISLPAGWPLDSPTNVSAAQNRNHLRV